VLGATAETRLSPEGAGDYSYCVRNIPYLRAIPLT
jgi:hypothetical protein